MKNILKQYKNWIAIVISCGAVLAVVFFVVFPIIAKIKVLTYNIQAEKIDHQMKKERVSGLPEMIQLADIFRESEPALDIFLKNDKQVEFIESIEAMAQTTNNEINLNIKENDASFAALAKKDGILKNLTYTEYIPIEIDLKGDYYSLVNFIYLLENGQFYVNLISVSSVVSDSSETENRNIFGSVNIEKTPKKETVSKTLKTVINAIVYK